MREESTANIKVGCMVHDKFKDTYKGARQECS